MECNNLPFSELLAHKKCEPKLAFFMVCIEINPSSQGPKHQALRHRHREEKI